MIWIDAMVPVMKIFSLLKYGNKVSKYRSKSLSIIIHNLGIPTLKNLLKDLVN